MNIFNIKLAGLNFKITALYADILAYCEDYICESEADEIKIVISPTDIDYERKKSEEMDKVNQIPVRRFSNGYLETLAVYRKIAEILPSYHTILFHGSALAMDGEGYLFGAKSGTGKSTHAYLWRQYFGNRVQMVNDDKPLIQIKENKIEVFGTPWNGKHRLGKNISAPLKAICFLERGVKNQIEQIDIDSTYPLLLRQTYYPQNAGQILKTLELLDTLTLKIKFYRLRCNMEEEAAEVAYHAMRE